MIAMINRPPLSDRLASGKVIAGPGTFVLIPPGVEHGFRNDGDAPARILNVHAPGGFDRRIGLQD